MRGYRVPDSGDSRGPQTLLVLASAIAIMSLGSVPVRSQTQKAAKTKTTAAVTTATPWTPPRTAWGDPDLQGVWNFATLTPLERPRELAGKEVLTDEEAAAFEKLTIQQRLATLSTGDREWWDPGTKVMNTRRTSLVVDPRDGRVPPLTPEAQKRAAARADARRGRGSETWSTVRGQYGDSAGGALPGPANGPATTVRVEASQIHTLPAIDPVAITARW